MVSAPTTIGENELRAILAGLEGVTPGPWFKEMHQDEEEDIPAFYVSSQETSCDLTVVARMGEMSDNGSEDAAHIARLDPETVRSIVTELLARRSDGLGTVSVDALAQEIRRVDGSHSLGAGELAEALLPFLSCLTSIGVEARPCTCHPDDRPEQCQRKYALTDCLAVASAARVKL